MVIKQKSLMPYYAAMATLGSVTGCLVLHHLASRGGERFLRTRVKARRVERAQALIQRHGLLALLIPSLLPPPAPFKLFVLLAGVAKVPRGKFLVAVAIGRGVRYFGQGLLAIWYGDRAMELLDRHGREVAYAIAGTVVAGIIVYALWRWLRANAPKTATEN
jgi:membrane protein YqaA with SNARE-associated domain